MIKAIFPAGVTDITVNGLHQWDYGQQLVIETADVLPGLVEVHFACAGMKEAVVRSCSGVTGTVTAAIPDPCLEQSTPIIAWVYDVGENDGTTGTTILTVTLPIIARTRPQTGASVPTAVSDKYTEAVAAMNEAVAQVTSGDLRVAFAEKASSATDALEAQFAYTANEANHATKADTVTSTEISTGATAAVAITEPGIYVVEAATTASVSAIRYSCVIVIPSLTNHARALLYVDLASTAALKAYYICFNHTNSSDNYLRVTDGLSILSTYSIHSVRRIATL